MSFIIWMTGSSWAFSTENPKKLRKGNYSKLNDKTRDRLVDFFRPHNLQFYDLVGKNFDWEK